MSFPVRLPSPVAPAASLADLRTAVSGLGLQSSLAVSAVRAAFTAGAPPLQTVSSGSAADYLGRFGGGGVAAAIVDSTSRLGLVTAVGGTSVSPPRPELDQVTVATGRHIGVGDSYYVHVVVSVRVDDLPRVSQLRLMRADGDVLDTPVPTSVVLEQIPFGNTRKTIDPIGAAAFRSAAVGLGSQVSLFVRDDAYSNARSVVASASLRPVVGPPNTNRIGTSSGLLSIANADPSVISNLAFFLTQRAQTAPAAPTIPLTTGQRQGINVLGGGSVAASAQVAVVPGNSMGFREISRVPASPDQTVGDFAEFEFVDQTVVYGRSYTYYSSCLSDGGVEGPRSRLVRVDVVRRIPPASPDVLYSVVAGRPRFSVRCSGTFVDHVEVYRRGGQVPELVRILGTDRAMVIDGPPGSTDSGFVHVGDLAATHDRSTTYVDPAVPPGRAADYRFYTVDAYGVKCQTPFSCSVIVPDHGRRIPLGLPNITAEQGVSPSTVNVSVSCDDPRVVSFVVLRRETGTGEHGYHQPSQPDRVRFGTVDMKRGKSRLSPILQGSQKAWLGVLSAVSGASSMVDTAVDYDRTYQYAVAGVDLKGNLTSYVNSQPVRVAIRPVADPPVALSCSVLADPSGRPNAVEVSWKPGTADFSPNDLIGDQDVLAATAVRTVYQVERRELGSPSWLVMPATTATLFYDTVSDDPAPSFRPEYAKVGREYQYRVISMQSGGFISPHTDPFGVVVGPVVPDLAAVYVRSAPLAVRPAQVIVSWNYDGDLVDGWHVERASTNKVFGSKIVSMDSVEARSLAYRRVAEVKVESSRALGANQRDRRLDPSIYVGNRFYIDQDVDPVNSYFYRVRAVDLAGRVTGWTYGGVLLADSPHDRKFYSTLSDDEKVALAHDPRPIVSWRP